MAIPKILHQTYKTTALPDRYESYRRKLIDLHPGWEYRFYTDEACRRAVQEHLPCFLPIYDRMSVIQKTDIFRMIVVSAEGGFYLDIDVESLKPFDDLCEFRCVFGEEKTLSKAQAERSGHRSSLRVSNYMFASEAGRPFLLHILGRLAEASGRGIRTENDVLESTGPGLVTTVHSDLKDDMKEIVLIRNRDRICPQCGTVSCHFGDYARHHHMGSWRWDASADVRGSNSFPPSAAFARRELQAVKKKMEERAAISKPPDPVYVLQTYKEKPYDGLSCVYVRSKPIGIVVDDTKHLKNKKVLVSGLPAAFADRLCGDNTNVVYTTFETSALPDFWVEAINGHYQYCIVPHPHVKQVFEDSGVKIPVAVIHQGFTRYSRIHRKPIQRDGFRIGFLGVPYSRKNLFKLYQACVNLLGEIPDLRLAVHSVTLHGDMCTPHFMLIKHAPFVEWTEGALGREEVAKWYGRLACYVFPSSGEGWSFTPRESLYLGIPTLISDIPVHRDLTAPGYCGTIPVSGKEDSDYGGRSYGRWDRVRVADIETAIRELYRNYGRNLMRALEGSRWIETRWTNESSQQRLLEFMLRL